MIGLLYSQTTTKQKNKKNKKNNMELLDKLNWRYAAKAMNGKSTSRKN
jgi:hypothetical protein